MSIGLGIGVQRPKQLRSIYSVAGKIPGFTADFIRNKYPGHSSLSSAITHARSSNATMTDGYGPELVTNGTFDSDLSGWTDTNSHWSVVDGRAYHASSSAYNPLSLTLSLSGTYILTFDAEVISASNTAHLLVDGTSTQLLANGSDSYSVFITDATTIVFSREPGSTAEFYIDNVSVREMPVIKWAPHNLFQRSEELDHSYWNTKSHISITPNSTTAPNGTATADKIVANGNNTIHFVARNFSYPVASETYELCVFAKPAGYNFIKLFGANSDTSEAWFDISNGTKGATGGTGFVSSSITDVGNGWYRCALKFINPDATTRNTGYYPTPSNNVDSYSGDGTSGIHIWGAHLYKADLGGMVDNPDRGDSYVPTTSAAKYLPRVGHHVYNGSAWVNEGVLAESESRTNIITGNDDLDNATYWTNTSLSVAESTTVIAPDGGSSYLLTATGNNFSLRSDVSSIAPSSGNYITLSVYVKEGNTRYVALGMGGNSFVGGVFDFDTESFVDTDSNNFGSPTITTTVENVGNGWYRIALTLLNDTGNPSYGMGFYPWNSATTPNPFDLHGSSSSSETLYVAFPQAEYYATPSSPIPTSGSSVTRAAETFTIPSANLPWPTPQYIGSELVANGTFDTDLSGWTASGNWAWSSGTATHTTSASGENLSQSVFTAGKVYEISWEQSGDFVAVYGDGLTSLLSNTNSDGTITKVFASQSGGNITFRAATGTTSIDNISVREINPLSVSIGMEGRVTYADTDVGNEVNFFRWYQNNQNLILNSLQTGSSRTGQIQFRQESNNVNDYISTSTTYFSPDILVPYNITSRHGSTFVNGAESGVALTANTTPVSLPDLSSTNVALAHKYMGTIGTFRVWDKDLGDDGIVEATNPSLEPSLSLTFEGTGTNSFVVNNWSE
jgi:hypothetical protein